MRVEFCQALPRVLARDPLALLVSGDLGFQAFEGIAKAYPKRFINAGVAEQNMIGFATGLALAGFRPWVYSIAPFVVFRAFEQIRNDVCFHRQPIRIVGNGGGFTYGIMGPTHHALEDLGVLKTLPGITSFFPALPDQVEPIVEYLAQFAGPAYLRLGISGYQAKAIKPLHEVAATFTRQYFAASTPRVTLIAIGQATQLLLHALETKLLPTDDVDAFSISRFPFDPTQELQLMASVARSRRVLVIEEHFCEGGLGESLRRHFPAAIGYDTLAPDSAIEAYGSRAFISRQRGLTPAAVAQRVAALLQAD